MKDRPTNVLFLCTGNSARSIMAEALMNRLGEPDIRGFSAGSHPQPRPQSLAIATLARRGHGTEGLRSKSWDEFARPEAPPIDVVITVCDNAAGETCPVWPGHPVVAHWSLEDPVGAEAFERTYDELERRIRSLIELGGKGLDRETFARSLSEIETEGGVNPIRR